MRKAKLTRTQRVRSAGVLRITHLAALRRAANRTEPEGGPREATESRINRLPGQKLTRRSGGIKNWKRVRRMTFTAEVGASA
jgi:hypothetical protein